MKTSDFYYNLPTELIAQTPLANREQSRMMVVDRGNGTLTHSHFFHIVDYLNPGDCLILNDSRVMPARLNGINIKSEKPVELLLLTQHTSDTWEVLAGPGKRARVGDRIRFGEDLLHAEVLDVLDGGNRLVRFQWEGNSFWAITDQLGEMPLPPYIREKLENGERYQTVYARELGSAAAPTAGLHFTDDIMDKLRKKGVSIGFLTLHVGIGTFRPVKVENPQEHKMHAEAFTLSKETAELINRTKEIGGKVYAVGTTCCRTLEHIARKHGKIIATSEWTDIFIYPGFQFKVLDGMLTNFHLPESTLIMLVSAFAGLETTMNAYTTAVKEGYRFFSFGDCMMIL